MADRHITEKLLEGERLSGKVTLFAKVTPIRYRLA